MRRGPEYGPDDDTSRHEKIEAGNANPPKLVTLTFDVDDVPADLDPRRLPEADQQLLQRDANAAKRGEPRLWTILPGPRLGRVWHGH